MFALIASTVGTIDIEDLARLQVYIVLYALVALALGLWVLPALITALTPLRYGDIVRALRTPLITAFATGSSLIVLPLLVEQCKRMIADAKTFDRLAQEHADSSIEVLIPTFYTFPHPGVLLALSFVLFAGWYIGMNVSVAAYPTLFFAGVPSLFGGTLLTIPFLLDLMRNTPISASLTQLLGMSVPVLRWPVGLLVKDHDRGKFQTWDDIRELEASFRLAFENSPGKIGERIVKSLLPSATLTPYYDLEEKGRILESGAKDIDAIADMAEAGAAWTLLYPSYTVIVPKPTVFIPSAYAVALGNENLLSAFNAWLTTEKAKGTVDALYKHWMLGEAAKIERPPRWSVIRVVLGWVKK